MLRHKNIKLKREHNTTVKNNTDGVSPVPGIVPELIHPSISGCIVDICPEELLYTSV